MYLYYKYFICKINMRRYTSTDDEFSVKIIHPSNS